MRKTSTLRSVLLLSFLALASLSGISQTIGWNFGNTAPGTASPTTNVAGITTSDLIQGNNNGTTTFLTTSSASSGYTGASGSYNAGLAARIGALNTGASGSAY